MNISVADLRVIVTGAGSGIGQTIAQSFLENDAKVYICDISEKHLAEIIGANERISGRLTDVCDPVQVDSFFVKAMEFLGGLDVLVNNVGVSGPIGPVEKISLEGWNQTIATNLNSQFYCVRRAIPLIKGSGGGSIINMSSISGLFSEPLRSPYVASKWAIIGFTKTLAMELGEFNIRVNAICPGCVEGPRIDGVIEREAQIKGESIEVVRESFLRFNSLRTFISSQEIASMILYLCSNAGEKITGQALTIDGNTETLR